MNKIELLSCLHKYPKIRDRIIGLWGTEELKDYLDSILQDNRGNTRNGFPQDICDVLLRLSIMHTKFLEDSGIIDKIEPVDFTPSTWKLPKNF